MDDFWPLAAFVAVSTLTPGGATTLATASGAHFGLRRSAPLIAGIAVGLGAIAAGAAAGLAGLLLALPSLQVAMRLAGSAYMLLLAWRIARAGSPHAAGAPARPTRFLGGMALVAQNPEAWAMTLGAAASFAGLAAGPGGLAALLGLSFAAASAGALALWCVAGQMLARRLRSAAQWRAVNAALGLMLAASVATIWL